MPRAKRKALDPYAERKQRKLVKTKARDALEVPNVQQPPENLLKIVEEQPVQDELMSEGRGSEQKGQSNRLLEKELVHYKELSSEYHAEILRLRQAAVKQRKTIDRLRKKLTRRDFTITRLGVRTKPFRSRENYHECNQASQRKKRVELAKHLASGMKVLFVDEKIAESVASKTLDAVLKIVDQDLVNKKGKQRCFGTPERTNLMNS